MAADENHPSVKNALDNLYLRYNRHELIGPDPLQFVYKYSQPADMEIAGLLSALLAYGRVEQIQKSLTNLFSLMNAGPYDFVINFNRKKQTSLYGFKHRFNTEQDIADLLLLLRKILLETGSIENYFLQVYKNTDRNIIPALMQFCDSLLKIHSEQNQGQIRQSFKYLLASPSAGSSCKRINLFLRWMVRADDIDAGIWKTVNKSKLIVPLDVHMGRLCRIIGFHNDKTISLKTALRITERFAEISPADPVKYDFALSRVGIVENCTGSYRPQCDNCLLINFCREKNEFLPA